MEIVQTKSPSGAPVILKRRMAIDFGSIPSPFTKEVTATFTEVGVGEAELGDGVSVSAAQSLLAGVGVVGARVSANGVIAVTMSASATLTPNTVTLDVYVNKGGTDV